MNHNTPDPYDDLPTHLLASTSITTYRRRRHILRRLAILALILLALLALARLAAAAPPRPTDKPWPPTRPNYTYICKHRPEIAPYPACIRSRPPIRP